MPKITFKVELTNSSNEIEMIFANDAALIGFLNDIATGKIDQRQFDDIMNGLAPPPKDGKIDVIILGVLGDLTQL